MKKAVLACALAAVAAAAPAAASLQKGAPHPAWVKAVDSVMGTPAEMYSEGVARYGLSRSDLSVTINGMRMQSALVADGYIAFKLESGGRALAVAEIVLTERQIDRATALLSAAGLSVTALHNHLFGESPDVYFLHADGSGDARTIASAVRKTLSAIGYPKPDNSEGSQTTNLNNAAITKALNETPRIIDGVLEYTAERKERVTNRGLDMPADMGPESEIHFQSAGAGRAFMAAEFALTASEVPGAVRYLRTHGVSVSAVHNHWLFDSPHIFFVHADANGDAVALAKVAREVLDRSNVK